MSQPWGDQEGALVYFGAGNATIQLVDADHPLPTTAQLNGNVTVGNITVTSGNITNTPHVASTFLNNQLTIGNTPTAIFGAGNQTAVRKVNTTGNVTVFIGNATVADSTGYALTATQPLTMENNSEALYGIVTSGNTTVTILGW